MAKPRLKTKLKALAKQTKMSGQSEFRCLTDFLNECYEQNNQENKQLLLTICDEFIDHATYIKKELCDEFIDHATYIKKELSKCQG